MQEAVATLTEDGDGAYEGLDAPEWNCNAGGVFRNIARPVDGWDFRKRRQLQELASWPPVEQAFRGDTRLSRQIGTLVGTILGGIRMEPYNFAMHVLPRPSELDCANEIFEQRYAELDAYLAANDIGFKTIWPVPGVIVANMPIVLEPDIVLDAMSDRELVVALRTEIVRPVFGNQLVFQAEPASRTCVRYRYRLSKLIGSRGEDASAQFGVLEQRLQDVRATIEEALALVLPEPIMTAGRFGTADEQWSPSAGGVQFQQSMMPRYAYSRHIEVDDQWVSELREVWKLVSQRGLLIRNKGLALALRRLSYQAQRERAEDELLDVMIAAEALYLAELGRASERGDLRFRVALRAAVWADDPPLGMTKREVLKLMKSAYDARSAVAHGGSPDPKEVKIKGQRIELSELVKVTRIVVARGCRKALAAAASDISWPPDWDALVLEPAKPTEDFAGDYLIWLEVMNEAKIKKRDVLIVTGDAKEDWWRRERGAIRGPRPELVRELKEAAGVKLFMLRPDSLLMHAQRFLEVRVHDESVKDVERVADQIREGDTAESSVDLLYRSWSEILKTIKGRSKVAWLLLKSATIVEADTGSVTIEFQRKADAQAFVRRRLELVLAETISEFFDSDISVIVMPLP
jgi:PIN like domain/Apea-like HEPN